MKSKIKLGARLALGAIYFIFGLNGFLQFLPMPPLPPEAGNFLGALAASGYFFPVLKGTEVLAGAALLAGRFEALALIVLAPITIQIFLFHAFLTPGLSNLILPLVIVGLQAYLAWSSCDKFKSVLSAK